MTFISAGWNRIICVKRIMKMTCEQSSFDFYWLSNANIHHPTQIASITHYEMRRHNHSNNSASEQQQKIQQPYFIPKWATCSRLMQCMCSAFEGYLHYRRNKFPLQFGWCIIIILYTGMLGFSEKKQPVLSLSLSVPLCLSFFVSFSHLSFRAAFFLKVIILTLLKNRLFMQMSVLNVTEMAFSGILSSVFVWRNFRSYPSDIDFILFLIM